jgi:hypothetical protein
MRYRRKLSSNKLAIAHNGTQVVAWQDNSWTLLHLARSLPVKHWLAAREVICRPYWTTSRGQLRYIRMQYQLHEYCISYSDSEHS